MNRVLSSIVLACAMAAIPRGQSTLIGTWQLEPIGPRSPWTLFLQQDGSRLTGLVSHCATYFPSPVWISDARLSGDVLTFKCTSPSGDRSVTFSGAVHGDSITFTWQRTIRSGGVDNGPVDKVFGSNAPRQFTVQRAPNGALAGQADAAWGQEFAGAVNLLSENAKADGVLFLSRKVTRARAVITVINYGLGETLDLTKWRKLSESVQAALLSVRFSNIGPSTDWGQEGVSYTGAGPEVLSALMRRLAQESGHPELANAPMVWWGHSGAGGVSSILAGVHPDRTIAFVRYHSGPVGGDLNVVSKIPSLLLNGGKDSVAPVQAAEGLWKSGRALGAPWTFGIEANAVHGDPKDAEKATDFIVAWIAAVIHQRLPAGDARLRHVDDSSAWLGNNLTGDVAPYAAYSGTKAEASWLPDEASARAWAGLSRPAGK